MVGQQRQQISELQFDKFPTPSSFLYWKIRFKNEVTTCSDFPSEAMLWIKEVEMVDSVDELKSSRSIAGKNFPNLQKLDAKIASALNNIIQNSHFKKKVSLEEQESPEGGPVSTRKTDRLHDLRLFSSHWRSVLDYADSFSITLRNDNVQDFDTRWDEILLSMTKIPSDDILESL